MAGAALDAGVRRFLVCDPLRPVGVAQHTAEPVPLREFVEVERCSDDDNCTHDDDCSPEYESSNLPCMALTELLAQISKSTHLIPLFAIYPKRSNHGPRLFPPIPPCLLRTRSIYPVRPVRPMAPTRPAVPWQLPSTPSSAGSRNRAPLCSPGGRAPSPDPYS